MKLLLVTLAFVTAATSIASVRDEIEAQYARWARAALVNDVETVLSVLAPDYTLKTYTDSVIDRKAYEKSLRDRRARKQKSDAYQTKIASLNVQGRVATVISDETSIKAAKDPITKQAISMVHIHRYQDTWVKLGKSWRLKSTVTQMESTRIVPARATR